MSSKMNALATAARFFAVSLLASCTDEIFDDKRECTGALTAAVTSEIPAVISEDLVVRGTVTSPSTQTVRAVSVAGIPATADGFNFSQWSATVPLTTLLALKGNDIGGGRATVSAPISITSSCGGPTEVTSAQLTVDRQARITVSTLSLQASTPTSGQYFPLNGSALVLLTATANPEARGATVSFTASGGATLNTSSVVLSGDGTSAATATVQVSPATSGVTAASGRVVLVGAISKGIAANPAAIRFAGGPRILPSAFTLGPGQSVTATVLKGDDSQVATCKALAGDGVTVTAGSASLTEGDAPAESITVRVDSTIAASTKVLVSCHDAYGQTGDAAFTISVPEKDGGT
jgi:hypothetical protein